MLIAQAQFLNARKHFQFFPLALLFFFYLAWSRKSPEKNDSQARRLIALICFTGFLFGSIVAVIFFSPWLAQISAIAILFGWMLVRLGGNPVHQLASWVSVLAITVPPPRNLDESLIQQLQRASTAAASKLLDVVGVPHLTSANIIETRFGKLFVDQACSGIDSLYALAAIALMLILYQQRTLVVSLGVLASVPAWAIVGNLLRIFVIVTLLDKANINLSEGAPHTAIGLVLFAVSSIGLLLTQATLSQLLRPFETQAASSDAMHSIYNSVVCWPAKDPALETTNLCKKPDVVAHRRNQTRDLWTHVGVGVQFLLMICVGVGSTLQVWSMGKESPIPIGLLTDSIDSSTVDAKVVSNLMPPEWMNMHLLGFRNEHRSTGSAYGEHSATWTYRDGTQVVQVSADFPFQDIHRLEVCYQLVGYQVAEPIPVVKSSLPSGQAVNIYELTMTDEFGEVSVAFFLLCRHDGQSPEIPKPQSIVERGLLAARQSVRQSQATLQFQMFAANCGALNETQKARYRMCLVDAVDRLFPLVSPVVWTN